MKEYECEFCEVAFGVEWNTHCMEETVGEPKYPICGKSGDVIPK